MLELTKKAFQLMLILVLGCSFKQPTQNDKSIGLDQGLEDAKNRKVTYIKNYTVSEIGVLRDVLNKQYAPADWKRFLFGWTADEAFDTAANAIWELNDISTKKCRNVFKTFVNSPRDFHVGLSFYSTERASLPFEVKTLREGSFVTEVMRECRLNSIELKLMNKGDRVLEINGVPIKTVIKDIMKTELRGNSLSDKAEADIMLTFRTGKFAHYVPNGFVQVKLFSHVRKSEYVVRLFWDYTPERITDMSSILFKSYAKDHYLRRRVNTQINTSIEKFNSLAHKKMMHRFFEYESVKTADKQKRSIVKKRSVFPDQKNIVWESNEETFGAYIFDINDKEKDEYKEGFRVGYIRIPHYLLEDYQVDNFASIMNLMNETTDVLILDQLHNPGGDLFCMYGIASALSNKEMAVPLHKIALTQSDIDEVVQLLDLVNEAESFGDFTQVLGTNLAGYALNPEMISKLKVFCEDMLNEWNQGHLLTKPLPIFGIDKVQPSVIGVYEKPILMLIDQSCFSCGDFLPAILQDNNRAVLLGTTTGGAGGYCLGLSFPNFSGINEFQYTGSIAVRENGSYIENIGVIPHIECPLTVNDLINNYSDYSKKVVDTVEKICIKQLENRKDKPKEIESINE